MLRKELLTFFFSLLAFSLAFAALNVMGFHVVNLSEFDVKKYVVTIVFLSGISTLFALAINKSKSSRG